MKQDFTRTDGHAADAFDDMAMKDPYEALGVPRTATQDEIRTAYRRLAKTLHPDLNPGAKETEEKFKEVSAAYDLLSDAEKRKRFDSGEIDAIGAERPERRFYREYAGAQAGNAGYGNFADLAGDDDFLAQFFSQRGRGRGSDLHYELRLRFLDAVNGSTQRLALLGNEGIDLSVPAGVGEGQVLRLRGKGMPGAGGAPAGDLLVEISVEPHRFFRRDGDDILLDLPVTLKEAVLGARVEAPSISGPVLVTIPRGSSADTILRLKGKGVKRAGSAGDQLIKLKPVLPKTPDAELEKFLEAWSAASENPRKDMTP